MKHIRLSIVVLATFTFLSACSQSLEPSIARKPDLSLQFGTTAFDSATALAKYSSGVYVGGNTLGNLHATPKGSGDVFLRKVSAQGGLVWGRQFGSSGRDNATDIATDAQGNAYVLGTTSGNLARSPRGPSDFFLRKYTASGSVGWTLQFGLDTEDVPGGLVVSGNHVYVVGSHRGIGKALYKFNLSNGHTWFKKQFTNAANNDTSGVASDSRGNLYIASAISVSCDFDPSDACARVLLEKFSPEGARLWSKQLLFDAQGEPKRSSILGMTSYGDSVYLIVDSFAIPNDDSVARLVQLDTAGTVKWNKVIGSGYSHEYFSGSFDLSADSTGVYVRVTTNYNLPGDNPENEFVTYAFSKYSSLGTAIWQVGNYGFTDGLGTNIYGSLNAILAGGSSGLYIAGAVDQSATSRSSEAFLKRANPATGDVIWTR